AAAALRKARKQEQSGHSMFPSQKARGSAAFRGNSGFSGPSDGGGCGGGGGRGLLPDSGSLQSWTQHVAPQDGVRPNSGNSGGAFGRSGCSARAGGGNGGSTRESPVTRQAAGTSGRAKLVASHFGGSSIGVNTSNHMSRTSLNGGDNDDRDAPARVQLQQLRQSWQQRLSDEGEEIG
ncbi:unnamed protein product, partial [Phaeothamnion confervicola]